MRLNDPWAYGYCGCNVWPMFFIQPGRCHRCGEEVTMFLPMEQDRNTAIRYFIDIFQRAPWALEIERENK